MMESVGTGHIEVETSYPPLAFLYRAVTPTIQVNDERHRQPWGTSRFDVPPGHYVVAVSYPYLGSREAGLSRVTFDLAAGETKRVSYHAHAIRYIRGRIRVD